MGLQSAALFLQPIGLAFTLTMAKFQGSAWIVLVGTPVFAALTVVAYGWGDKARNWRLFKLLYGDGAMDNQRGAVFKSLRLEGFTSQQKWRIIRITVGNHGVNIGWTVAGALIGIGAGNAVVAAVATLTGLYFDWRIRRVELMVLRLGLMYALVDATNAWDQVTSTSPGDLILGLLLAIAAGWHFWNISKCLPFFENDEKKDKAMMVANVYSLPSIFAVPVIAYGGFGWMSGQVLPGVAAGLLVFVLPVILINRASKFIDDGAQGALFSLSPVFGGLIGTVGASFALLPESQAVHGKAWLGIAFVTIFAFTVVWLRREKDEAKVRLNYFMNGISLPKETPQKRLVRIQQTRADALALVARLDVELVPTTIDAHTATLTARVRERAKADPTDPQVLGDLDMRISEARGELEEALRRLNPPA